MKPEQLAEISKGRVDQADLPRPFDPADVRREAGFYHDWWWGWAGWCWPQRILLSRPTVEDIRGPRGPMLWIIALEVNDGAEITAKEIVRQITDFALDSGLVEEGERVAFYREPKAGLPGRYTGLKARRLR